VGTVRHWIRTGRLASFRLGRRRMVRREALDHFLLAAGDESRAAGEARP
jgi:excisionase family DNA binding protein